MLRKQGFKWTDQYDDFLRGNHGKTSNMLIAECIGSTMFDIEMRVKYLKIQVE